MIFVTCIVISAIVFKINQQEVQDFLDTKAF